VCAHGCGIDTKESCVHMFVCVFVCVCVVCVCWSSHDIYAWERDVLLVHRGRPPEQRRAGPLARVCERCCVSYEVLAQ
jgi:hypothetical protein